MGHVDVNRAGIVGAVILAGWHMAWSVLVLTLGGSSLLYLMIQRGAAHSRSY